MKSLKPSGSRAKKRPGGSFLRRKRLDVHFVMTLTQFRLYFDCPKRLRRICGIMFPNMLPLLCMLQTLQAADHDAFFCRSSYLRSENVMSRAEKASTTRPLVGTTTTLVIIGNRTLIGLMGLMFTDKTDKFRARFMVMRTAWIIFLPQAGA